MGQFSGWQIVVDDFEMDLKLINFNDDDIMCVICVSCNQNNKPNIILFIDIIIHKSAFWMDRWMESNAKIAMHINHLSSNLKSLKSQYITIAQHFNSVDIRHCYEKMKMLRCLRKLQHQLNQDCLETIALVLNNIMQNC